MARPDDLGIVSVRELVQIWIDARLRVRDARHQHGLAPTEVDPADILTVLAAAERADVELRASRWCYVHDGLVAQLSLRELADALDVTPEEVAAGYRSWVLGQLNLHRQDGRYGLTDAEADDAIALLDRAGAGRGRADDRAVGGRGVAVVEQHGGGRHR